MRLPRGALLLAGGLLAAMFWSRRGAVLGQRIIRISRVVSDLHRAETFYREGLGFRTISRGPSDKATLFAVGLDDTEAEEVVMQLGDATVALVRFSTLGHPYPAGSRSNDLWFQHLAIVVGDMDAAYAHLSRTSGWQPISQGGPWLLPPSNGSVRAFKFRDPDGHPLELIWFPSRAAVAADAGTATGIDVDHSALTIASTVRSLRFYRSLGFHVSARSFNHGPAQDGLDGLPEARVRVTGLRLVSGTRPGLELLDYQRPGRRLAITSADDLVTDWVTIMVRSLGGERIRGVRDPDGHRLVLVALGPELPVRRPATMTVSTGP